MSHRISREEAIQKYKREKEIQQMMKEGKPYKSKRHQRKKQRRETKFAHFIGMLKDRGGYFKKKEDEKSED